MILLTMRPVASRPGSYEAVTEDGKVLCRSRTPFFDAARVLLGRGVAPDTPLASCQAGSDAICMRSTVGHAAKWSVSEPDRRRMSKVLWTPYFPQRGDAPGTPEAQDAPEGGHDAEALYAATRDGEEAAGNPDISEMGAP